MGVFDDKKFEQLDWMTQITETIDSRLNDILASLPDRVELSIDSLKERGYFSIRVDNAVRSLLESRYLHHVSWDEADTLSKCFVFEMSPTFEIDFEKNTSIGTLALVKAIPTLTDEQLQPMMGAKGLEALRSIRIDDEWPFDRMNEMLDVLGGCEIAQKNRSVKKKLSRIRERLTEIMTNNEWRIRDMDLADRVGHWIADYIAVGNLASLTNLCKLKVMTHRNMPIYSMEEEK